MLSVAPEDVTLIESGLMAAAAIPPVVAHHTAASDPSAFARPHRAADDLPAATHLASTRRRSPPRPWPHFAVVTGRSNPTERCCSTRFYWKIAWNTLYLGVNVAVLAVILSYPIALFLARTQSRWRGVPRQRLLLRRFSPPRWCVPMAEWSFWGTGGVINTALQSSA